MTNLEIAQAFFNLRFIENKKINPDEIFKVMNFLIQCEKEGYKLIAIAYHVYVGNKKYHELDLDQMYEGGFAIEKKGK